jgi:hypothetical protein
MARFYLITYCANLTSVGRDISCECPLRRAVPGSERDIPPAIVRSI